MLRERLGECVRRDTTSDGATRHDSTAAAVRVRVVRVVDALEFHPCAADDFELTAIAFENVSLAFDENVVLRDVSFSVRPGSTLFLLGASGSGKSSC